MPYKFTVTIFGTHAENWMEALRPGAPVWDLLPIVSEIRLFSDEYDTTNPRDYDAAERAFLLPLMESHIEQRPAGFYTCCPKISALKILEDKGLFAEYVKLEHLEAYCARTLGIADRMKFPLVAKPTRLNAGRGIQIIHNEDECRSFFERGNPDNFQYIFQEFVNTTIDFSAYLVCRDGRVVWHHSYVFDVSDMEPIRGTVTAPGRVFALTSEHVVVFESVLKPLGYTGPCNIDFRFSEDATIKILEINPRIGGSLVLPENVEILAQVLETMMTNSTLDE